MNTPKGQCRGEIRLTAKVRHDLAIWDLFLQHFNGAMSFLPILWTSSDVLHLASDASGFAFSAVLQNSCIQGSFPPSWSPVHISSKELLPIVLAIRTWAPRLANRRIIFLTDNSAAMEVINKQSSRDLSLMRLV